MSPYLLSYDFILLLVLFVMVYNQVHTTVGKIVLIGAYILPWMVLFIGRKGNYLLLVSTFSLLSLVWISKLRKPIAELDDIKSYL